MMADVGVHKRAVWRRLDEVEQREWASELRRECGVCPSTAVTGGGPAATTNDNLGWQVREWDHEVSILIVVGAVGR
jgi:hypothetical protein